MLPIQNENPAFQLTRASHVTLAVTDLAKSRDFYRDVVGLVVTEETSNTVYMRGLEEAAHHSLVLELEKESKAKRIGLRVRADEDIFAAEKFFKGANVEYQRVDREHQGPTLQFRDPVGTLMEITSEFEVVERKYQAFNEWRAGAPQRIDHYQIVTYDVQTATDFWSHLGMRMSEYTTTEGSDDTLWGAWLEVKGNTHDLVFANGRGPRMHHFAYAVPDGNSLLHAADVAGALGAGNEIDRGPGRHGLSNALFLYLRDPDGHRVELFNSHYQFIDRELTPIKWDITDPRRAQLWGMPASERWFFEASEFPGEEPQKPLLDTKPETLEAYLGLH